MSTYLIYCCCLAKDVVSILVVAFTTVFVSSLLNAIKLRMKNVEEFDEILQNKTQIQKRTKKNEDGSEGEDKERMKERENRTKKSAIIPHTHTHRPLGVVLLTTVRGLFTKDVQLRERPLLVLILTTDMGLFIKDVLLRQGVPSVSGNIYHRGNSICMIGLG